MKFGSVRFFKKALVYATFVLLVAAVVLAVVFGVLYAGQKKRAKELEIELATRVEPAAQSAPAWAEDVSDASDPLPGDTGYRSLYPHLYAAPPLSPADDAPAGNVEVEDAMVCYLTFDDGPSPVTADVLDTLDAYGIRATFFVTGAGSEKDEDLLRRAAQAGHTIGVHTYSHDYNTVYASVEAFLADFDEMYRRIAVVTGDAPTIFRFPGGSVNAYNADVRDEIVAEMERRGFVFFDWNAAGNDAVVGGADAEQITDSVLASASGHQRAFVLLHDSATCETTAQALPAVIEGLWERGYQFQPLTNAVQPVSYYSMQDD